MEEEAGHSEFLSNLAKVCDEAAYLVLHELKLPSAEHHPKTFYEECCEIIRSEIGSDIPYGWLNEIVGAYLTEAAFELQAIAKLIEERAVQASLDVVVRAIAERIGVVNWILDVDITARARAVRSGLIYLDSFQRYMRTANQMKLTKSDLAYHRQLWKEVNVEFRNWFEIGYLNSCDCFECSKVAKDVANWNVEGESIPSWSKFTAIALRRQDIPEHRKNSSYALLSGFSHPSVIFSREQRGISAGGQISYEFRHSNIESSSTIAIASILESVRHWAGFYLVDDAEVIARTNVIGNFLRTISILDPPTDSANSTSESSQKPHK